MCCARSRCRAAVPAEHRRFNFFQAFAARLGGEAISFLTFTGPLLGEATKVALLRKRVPLTYGVPALVVDNLLYNLSVVFFILSGACVMLFTYSLPPLVYYSLDRHRRHCRAGHRRRGAGRKAAHHAADLGSRSDGPAAFESEGNSQAAPAHLSHRVEGLRFLQTSSRCFLRHDCLQPAGPRVECRGSLCHAAHAWVTRRSVAQAYIIESLTKVINFVFAFVPGTIGVYEGGTEVVLQTLGFAAATGVALALVRKAGTIFWTSIGLLILTWRTLPNAWGRLLDRSPRLRRLMDSLVLSNIAHRPARTAVSILGTAVGVLLIVFTVGLAHGVLRERGTTRIKHRRRDHGSRVRLAWLSVARSPFMLPVSRAAEIATIEGVRAATPIGQALDRSDCGFRHAADRRH